MPSRRSFLKTASAATFAAASSGIADVASTQRVFVGTGTANGILAFDFDPGQGELAAAGVAAKIDTVDWLVVSPDRRFLFAACEVDSFNGRPTGEVASFAVEKSGLRQLSAQNSAAKGTCHIALDRTGGVLVSADYGGGSAASFQVSGGKINPAVWTEHYTAHGPNSERQEAAHAHFCSFSPDNRFAYINDLGGDMIHIYRLDAVAGKLTAASAFHAKAGAGPRTLHFHPNGHTAYSVNELISTVDVLEWHENDGSFTQKATIDLLPADYHGPTRACDTVIPRDGRFVYFANRDNNFLYTFKADQRSGALSPMKRSNCGGKTPRNFTLDPSERWMLVANQDSNNISVFARDAKTGVLAEEGKSITVQAPMRILFP
ncbi:MAG TPA: lactonase family protein [Terracidiphilus sp.]|jgi:6-phosphogluconolactonase|nr:lactonase family protein [Terracidiphilus sp.]